MDAQQAADHEADVSGKKDMMQLGKGTSAFNETSLLTSILTKGQ